MEGSLSWSLTADVCCETIQTRDRHLFSVLTSSRIFHLQTGGSKGYAFVEYDCDEVAKIVAETMNNYLMGERLIKCKYWSHTSLLITSMIPHRSHSDVTRHTSGLKQIMQL